MTEPAALPPRSALFDPAAPGGAFQLVSGGVMGGVSSGTLRHEVVAGRPALLLRGEVRLENNCGFLQIAADLAPGGAVLDASGWTGLAIDLFGPPERCGLHLRTTDLTRPWQSFRADLAATPDWQRNHFVRPEQPPCH